MKPGGGAGLAVPAGVVVDLDETTEERASSVKLSGATRKLLM